MPSLRSAVLFTILLTAAAPVLAVGPTIPNTHLKFPPLPDVSQLECSPSTITVCEDEK